MSEKLTEGESQPTPGPWEWVERSGYHDLVGANGKVVHSDGSACGEYDPDIDVKGPDGCLMKAAPDLLKACETFLQALSHEQLHWDLMKAAVAKARNVKQPEVVGFV